MSLMVYSDICSCSVEIFCKKCEGFFDDDEEVWVHTLGVFHTQCWENVVDPPKYKPPEGHLPEVKLSKTDYVEIRNNPESWLQNKLKTIKNKNNHTYFITFTKAKDVSDDTFIKRLKFELKRKFVKSFKCVIEHKDSNIHAHVLLDSNKHLKKDTFKTYIKSVGLIDLKNAKFDNGITEYMEKENKIFENVQDIIL